MIEILLWITILTMLIMAVGVWMIIKIPRIHWWARQMGIKPRVLIMIIQNVKATIANWISRLCK
jgi:hypothetical protein